LSIVCCQLPIAFSNQHINLLIITIKILHFSY
jgi:hypothetical protein